MIKLLLIFFISFQYIYASECGVLDKLKENNETVIDFSSVENENPSKIKVIYSPDSDTSREEEFDYRSRFSFTPQKAGIVQFIVSDSSGETVCTFKRSVHFDGLPLSGILIFLFAGTFLFLGTFFSLKSALKD